MVPLAGLGLAWRALPAGLAAASPSVVPVVVEVRQSEMDGQVPATAELKWTDGPAMTAPAWSGIVTAVSVQAGQTLRSGSVVARVDEIDRLAMHTPRPFHRPLQLGDRGDDVMMLRQALRDLGYSVAATPADLFDQQVSQATRRLQAKLSRAEGGPAAGVFQPSWFCWLPLESLVVGETPLKAGQAAPAMGEPVAVGLPTLAALSVKVAETVRLRDEPYRFRYGDKTVSLDHQRNSSVAELRELSSLIEPKAESVEGQLRLVKTYQAMVVPVGAVQADAEGQHCLHVVAATGYTPARVTVVGGRMGTAEVTLDSHTEARVLANPAELGLTCR